MKANVSLCIIARDESPRLERCLSSVRDYVEELIIVDTGSADNTVEIAKKYADRVEVFTDCNNKDGKINNFSLARNYAFSLATKKWVFWIDADDTVLGAENLPRLIAEHDNMTSDRPVMILLPYEYGHDHLGNCILRHYRERIVNPKDYFKWVNRVHEVLIPTSDSPNFHYVKSDLITIKHGRGNKVTEPNRNLRILQEVYEEDGEKDARQLYYLGLEYANVGDLVNSNKVLSRYIDLSGWDDEKCLACIKVAENYQRMNDFESAIGFATRAMTVKENWGEPFFSLSKSYYFLAVQGKDPQRNFQKCIHFGEMGLKLPPTDTVLFVDPMQRDYEIYTYLNFAYGQVGRIPEAINSIKMALQKRPDDSNLQFNLKLYESTQAKNYILPQLDMLQSVGSLSPESNAAIKSILLENKPPTTQTITSNVSDSVFATYKKMERESQIPFNKNALKIVFYVGNAVEPWNAENIHKGGIGGSETAVIQMSELFAKMGHDVSIYGDCVRPGIDLEGVFNGVKYFDHSKYADLTCDILITSRRPSAVDSNHNVCSRLTFLWVHDIHCGSELNPERATLIDKIFCLSQWHKGYMRQVYPWLPEDKFYVTRNGIELSRFEQQITRNPHRAVYSSSPDRGMEVVVKIWPRVRQRIPDAELHIFYGFESWENSVGNSEPHLNLIRALKQLLKDHEKHGVIFHGRVDQKRLAKEYLSSGVWPYLTWFAETSCISAMEAQAAGLRIITSPIAALNETVADRGALIQGDWLSADYQDRAVEKIVQAMSITSNDDRTKLQEYAKNNFAWSGVAEDWIKLFNSSLDKLICGVLAPYVPLMEGRV